VLLSVNDTLNGAFPVVCFASNAASGALNVPADSPAGVLANDVGISDPSVSMPAHVVGVADQLLSISANVVGVADPSVSISANVVGVADPSVSVPANAVGVASTVGVADPFAGVHANAIDDAEIKTTKTKAIGKSFLVFFIYRPPIF
jgi:hypothetical protein